MRFNLWSGFHSALSRFRRPSPSRIPNQTQQHGQQTETSNRPGASGRPPVADPVQSELDTLRALITEIHESERRHQKAERNLWRFQIETSKKLNCITIGGTIAGLVGSIAIIFSFAVAIKSLWDSEASEIRQLRAYLHADPPKDPIKIISANEIDAVAVVKFDGKTPAYNIDIAANASVYSGEPPFDIMERDPSAIHFGQRRGYLAFNDEIEVSGSFRTSTDMVNDIKSGHSGLYISGTVHYNDAFYCKRWLRFCYYFTGGESMTGQWCANAQSNTTDDPSRCDPAPR